MSPGSCYVISLKLKSPMSTALGCFTKTDSRALYNNLVSPAETSGGRYIIIQQKPVFVSITVSRSHYLGGWIDWLISNTENELLKK